VKYLNVAANLWQLTDYALNYLLLPVSMRARLSRQIWRPLYRPLRRYQHDLPHKEYFQNPGQIPLPDATPYSAPPAFPSPPSYFRRAFRSILWATLFGTLGLVSGVSLLTWDYLQPPFEPGSEEDQEMVEEIEAMMDSHPLVQGLREGGWEEKMYKQSQTRLLQTLSGTQGLSLRGFRTPKPGYTILVFYTGSGIEGWPDVIHGGLITTLFNEAANLQISGPNEFDFPQPHQVVVDFAESIRPGEIYSILIPPLLPLVPVGDDKTLGMFGVKGLLMRMDMAPEITTEIDEITKMQTDTVAIPTRSPDNTIFAQATFYAQVELTSEEAQADEGGQNESDP
jgi:hypothetical protein